MKFERVQISVVKFWKVRKRKREIADQWPVL